MKLKKNLMSAVGHHTPGIYLDLYTFYFNSSL